MSLTLAAEEPEAGPWRVESLSAFVDNLAQRGSRPAGCRRPLVVAIDGRSNNGKSTLAARISRRVAGSVVVHTDDIAWEHSRFGWADLLIDGVLAPLHRGQSVSYRPPRWDDHARPGSIDVPSDSPLVIIDGVGAGRHEVTTLIDTLIWVQADETETERRARARAADRPAADIANGPADGTDIDEDGWMAEERPFNSSQRTWERADLVVCSTPELSYDARIEVVVARLTNPR